MKVSDSLIPEVKILEPTVFPDERGYFFESFNKRVFEESLDLKCEFVQDNCSKSHKGVLRGLHIQSAPKMQAKLIRIVSGEIFDVAVDMRKNSVTYGKWVGEILSAQNKKQLWIPEGFAHGFLTLSTEATVLYKCSDYYSPQHEKVIAWDDKNIAIAWPISQIENISVSEKDANGIPFEDY